MVNISILKHTNWFGLRFWLGQIHTLRVAHIHTHKGINRAISSTASLAMTRQGLG